MSHISATEFHARLKGAFHGVLQWHQLEALWTRLKSEQWYFYQVGEALPENPLSGSELAERLDALYALLRHDHDYHYCGIVYVDDPETPSLIKVYDPNSLGSSCSSSDQPSPARWILSTSQPALVESDAPVPASRRRWWQRYF